MTTAPCVSIIMPLYNAASTLRETLDSVYQQDFSAWELVIHDDGSTDGSVQIAQRAAAADPQRVRFLQHPSGRNEGPAVTRNRAVEASSGELLAFLDADDVWLPDSLSECVRLMSEYPEAAMVWGPAEYFGDGMAPYIQHTELPDKLELYQPPALAELFVTSSRATPCTGTVVMRRSVFCAANGFETTLKRGEDISLWLKIAIAYPILYTPHVWFRYRRHDGSSTWHSEQSGIKQQQEVAYQRFVLRFVYDEPTLARMRPTAEGLYHLLLRQWAKQWPWPRSRIEVSRGLSAIPGLLQRRWWQLALDWLLPFGISRKVAARLSLWSRR